MLHKSIIETLKCWIARMLLMIIITLRPLIMLRNKRAFLMRNFRNAFASNELLRRTGYK